MSMTVYTCEKTSEIKETELSELQYSVPSSQFCIVYKYKFLYETELNCLQNYATNDCTPYALPSKGKIMREYSGIDREADRNTPDDFHLYKEEKALKYFDSLSKKDELEMIFIRLNGCDDEIPKGMSFSGYDVAYPFGCGYSNGFSAICDCMFLARWHGCDEEGTEFLSEFEKLNSNGLFDSAEDAYNYMIHYLSQDWTERGDFCIYEIYR